MSDFRYIENIIKKSQEIKNIGKFIASFDTVNYNNWKATEKSTRDAMNDGDFPSDNTSHSDAMSLHSDNHSNSGYGDSSYYDTHTDNSGYSRSYSDSHTDSRSYARYGQSGYSQSGYNRAYGQSGYSQSGYSRSYNDTHTDGSLYDRYTRSGYSRGYYDTHTNGPTFYGNYSRSGYSDTSHYNTHTDTGTGGGYNKSGYSQAGYTTGYNDTHTDNSGYSRAYNDSHSDGTSYGRYSRSGYDQSGYSRAYGRSGYSRSYSDSHPDTGYSRALHNDVGFNHANFIPTQPKLYNLSAGDSLKDTVTIGFFSYDRNTKPAGTQDAQSNTVKYKLEARRLTPVASGWVVLSNNTTTSTYAWNTIDPINEGNSDPAASNGTYELRLTASNDQRSEKSVTKNYISVVETINVTIKQNELPAFSVQNGNEMIGFTFGSAGAVNTTDIYNLYGSLYGDVLATGKQDGIFVLINMSDPDANQYQRGTAYLRKADNTLIAQRPIVWENAQEYIQSLGAAKKGYVYFPETDFAAGEELSTCKVVLEVGDYYDQAGSNPVDITKTTLDQISVADTTLLRFNIDNKAPVATFAPNGNAVYETQHNTTINVNDLSTIVTKEYQWVKVGNTLNPGAWVAHTFATPIQTPAAVTGSYRLYVRTIDKLNQERITISLIFNVDQTLPTALTNQVTQYNYKVGENYWIKQNTDLKIKIRGKDLDSGMKQSFIKINLPEQNVAKHDWFGTANNITETSTSTYTDIIGAAETYETGGDYEIEWTIRGLKDMALQEINFDFIDAATNAKGYAGTGRYIGVDAVAPAISDIGDVYDTSSITYTITATDQKTGVKDYTFDNGSTWQASNTYQYTGLTPNASYTHNVGARDNVLNEKIQANTFVTLAVDSIAEVLSVGKDEMSLGITHSASNSVVPQVKIIATNIADISDKIVHDFTTDTTVTLSGFTAYEQYKIEIITRNAANVENSSIVVSEALIIAGDDIAPTIQEFTANYGEMTVQEAKTDLKLLVYDDKTSTEDILAKFEVYEHKVVDGVYTTSKVGEYGYNSSLGVWEPNKYGAYQKYYPELPLGSNYANKNIVANVLDDKGNKAVSVDEVVFEKIENIKPEIKQSETNTEGDQTSGEVKYTNEGEILTADRFVLLELKSPVSTESQYSLDSIEWSPWEPTIGGFIRKYVTLDDKPGQLKTVYIRTRNEYKINSDIQVVHYILDQEAPAIKLATTNNINIAVDGNISLRIELQDNVSEVITYEIEALRNGVSEISISGEATSKVNVEHLTGLQKGFYIINITAKDELNNTSSSSLKIWSK